jgi:tetratricopeptide (TPR) repeat protein
MTSTARTLLPVLLAALIAGTPALAQQTGGGASASQPAPEMIDGLLGQLRQAENEAKAKAIEQAVWKAWMRSGSPTVDLLVQQAEKAMADRQHRIAISILSTAIELEPEFPEVWNRRATAYYLSRQFELALADAERVLELEPRHFAALAGLGVCTRRWATSAPPSRPSGGRSPSTRSCRWRAAPSRSSSSRSSRTSDQILRVMPGRRAGHP